MCYFYPGIFIKQLDILPLYGRIFRYIKPHALCKLFYKRFDKMKLSARNQFKGIVTNVNEGAVNGIVSIEVNGEVVSSTISMNAIKELELKKGVEAIAVIKATEVMIATELPKISARNKFKGTVKNIQEGAVNDIVTLDTKLGAVSSTISKNAVEELELSVGKEAYAVIKATSVMVGIE